MALFETDRYTYIQLYLIFCFFLPLNFVCVCFHWQVNFMSAQMLAAASKDVEVSGESLDEMKLLEEQARKIAEEAKKDQPQKKSMAFVK